MNTEMYNTFYSKWESVTEREGEREREVACNVCALLHVCARVLCNQSVAQFLPHFTRMTEESARSSVCLFVRLFICLPFPLCQRHFQKPSSTSTTAPSTFDYTFDILVQDDKEIDFCLSAATASQLDSPFSIFAAQLSTLKCPDSRFVDLNWVLRLFIENWVIAHRKVEKVVACGLHFICFWYIL